jgi:hypothetical protein
VTRHRSTVCAWPLGHQPSVWNMGWGARGNAWRVSELSPPNHLMSRMTMRGLAPVLTHGWDQHGGDLCLTRHLELRAHGRSAAGASWLSSCAAWGTPFPCAARSGLADVRQHPRQNPSKASSRNPRGTRLTSAIPPTLGHGSRCAGWRATLLRHTPMRPETHSSTRESIWRHSCCTPSAPPRRRSAFGTQ